MSGHVIAYAGDLNFYHNILSFLQECTIIFKKQNKTKQKKELDSNLRNGFKLSKNFTSV